ncbi:MAG: ATP-binding protein, partial [Planctomycetota bacterium]
AIESLVMDMLTFSKEREPELMPASVNRVVGDVVELIESHARDLEVELHWEPAEEMPELVFDPEGIHRAVLNVVTNGIDAASETEEAGRVDVATRYAPDEAKVFVVVSDNGPGIPPERLDGLFSPFVSFKSSHGTGLGLPVSQKILAEHGGRILVESTPGKGSRFTLELPAVPPDSGQETGTG